MRLMRGRITHTAKRSNRPRRKIIMKNNIHRKIGDPNSLFLVQCLSFTSRLWSKPVDAAPRCHMHNAYCRPHIHTLRHNHKPWPDVLLLCTCHSIGPFFRLKPTEEVLFFHRIALRRAHYATCVSFTKNIDFVQLWLIFGSNSYFYF